MKTTSLTSNCLQSFIPKQVSQSTGQDLVAFQVHPAALLRKFQQYFKFDRPSSLIQQEKPPGHKFTLAQGLVTCAQAIGRGTSHNLRSVFFFFFFFFVLFFLR